MEERESFQASSLTIIIVMASELNKDSGNQTLREVSKLAISSSGQFFYPRVSSGAIAVCLSLLLSHLIEWHNVCV